MLAWGVQGCNLLLDLQKLDPGRYEREVKHGGRADHEGPEVSVQQAIAEATAAIYFADNSDYLSALWSILRILNPELADLLERDQKRAFDLVQQVKAA